MKVKYQILKNQAMLSLFFICLILLLAAQVNAKPVDKEKAMKAAKTFLKIEQMREVKKGEKLAKTGGKILRDIEKRNPENAIPITGRNGEVFAWVTELKPEGYIVTSADDRINPIIAYSFTGKFPFEASKDNVLLYLVQWDMEARQKALNKKPEQLVSLVTENNKKWADYSSDGIATMESMALAEASGTQTQWPDPIGYGSDGWIKTEWDQGYYTDLNNYFQQSHYNDKCPQVPDKPDYRCQVGCVATALSQIINYWKFPSFVYFTSEDEYISKGDIGNISVFEDAIDNGFPSLSELNTHLSAIDYNGDTDEEAYLCFGAGVKLQMDYGFHESGTPTAKAANAFLNGFSYGSAKKDSKILLWTRKRNTVIENIKKGWPCQAGISYNLFWNNHSIIIDGYRDDGYFHINLGWHGTANTWYDLPSFEAEDYEFNLVHTVVYDISPYFGWHQYGGNQENSFRTIYSAPSEEPIREKWKGSINPNCKGMIVGSGNNIYIAKDPLIINDPSYHPSIVIINQYGEKLDEIVISETSRTISHPIQSPDGNIYFGAGDGVYKFRPDKKTYTRVFYDAGNNFYGDSVPRLDEEGSMYFGSGTTLVCLSSTGSQLWPSRWTCPSGGVMYTGIPSIDVGRNNVYISYWKSSTQTAHLVCINRLTGVTKYEKSFSNIPTADRGIYTPAIGSDGTVYTSARTKIYALTPGASLFTEKWLVKDFLYARYQPIALGSDDTIYTEYWTYSGGSYYVTFAAIDPTNGNVKWTILKPDVGSNTNFGQPYCAGNGVVIFPVKWDTTPNTFELFTYKDNGSSYQELWHYTTAHDENAKMAMGPGATIYLYQNNLITALSNGSVGDPDGGGMCYLDNARPNLPESPNPADGTTGTDTTVTLSWSCSDPENHSIKYSLFVGESGYNMVPVATELTEASYQLTDLEPATSYRWMIVATDGQAVSEGPTWTFTTDVSADINRDRKVNLTDYAVLAGKWASIDCNETNNWCEKADIDRSGVVDFNDLFVMAQNWLEGTSTALSNRIAIINPDSHRILKCGVVYNNNTYVSVANGSHADGDNLLGNPALWSGVGQQTDFIGSILTPTGCQVDYFEASQMPAISKMDYGIVIVQDPLRTNIVTFDKTTVDAGNLPDLLQHVTDVGFISKVDNYIQSGGNVVLVGDAVRLLENGSNRLNYGKSITAISPPCTVNQTSSWIPGQWLFVRGNPFCGVDRNGSGTYSVVAGDLAPVGSNLATVSLNNRSDMPYSHVWSDTIYKPADSVSLLNVKFQGQGDYVLDGSTCGPTVYRDTVDVNVPGFVGYTESNGRKIYCLGSDSFFDYDFQDWEGTWHTGQSMEIKNTVSSSGKNMIIALLNRIFYDAGLDYVINPLP